MKNKKPYYLIFMFVVLTLHTLVLTNWLSKEGNISLSQKHTLNSQELKHSKSNLMKPVSKVNVDSTNKKRFFFEVQ